MMRRLLLVLALAAPAAAQIALVSHTLIPNTANVFTSSPIDTRGANLILFCGSNANGNSAPAPTDNMGNTYTAVGQESAPGVTATLWAVFNPTTGASHIFHTTNGYYPGGAVAAYSGVASGPDGTPTGVQGVSAPQATGSVTPSKARELVFSCLAGGAYGTQTVTIASPMAMIDTSTGYGGAGTNSSVSTAQQIQGASASAVNPTWTYNDPDMAAVTASFYSVLAPAPLTVPTFALPEAFAGTPYSYQLSSNGGVSPKTWTHTGSFPTGFALSAGGLLTASSPSTAGTINGLTFTVSDANSSTATSPTESLTTASAPLSMPSTCPAGTQGTVYAGCSLAASGGTPPYTYAWANDSAHVGLPEGLTLGASTGAIAGTVGGQGEYDTTFTATDSLSASVTQTIPMHIAGNNSAAAALFFPSDHFLHGTDISQLPVDNSPATPASLPGTVRLVGGHYVSNGGIPLNYASGSQAYIPINCTPPNYVCEAASGPFSASTAVEGGETAYAGGNDSHGIVVQAANGSQPAQLFDTWRAFASTGPTAWNAVSIDRWDLSGPNAYKWVNGRVGADAAGLPIGAMIPTYDEVMSPGGYKRLTRMAFPPGAEFDYWVWPAQSTSPGYYGRGACSGGFVANSGNDNHLLSQANPPTSCGASRSQLIPLGEIYRIKASYTLPTCLTDGSSPQAASLAKSWRYYGGVNSDVAGFPQFILTADDRWNDADLVCLHQIPGSAWEPVNVSSLIRYDANGYPLSLQVKGPAIVPFFSGNVVVGEDMK